MPNVSTVAAQTIKIDTVSLAHAYNKAQLPSPDDLRERGFMVTFKETVKSGLIVTATPMWKFDKRGTATPYATVKISEHGYCGITVTVSLAKMLHHAGLENMTEDDLDCALIGIEDYVRQRTGVEFPARTAKVRVVDYNADFPIGEDNIIPAVSSIRGNGRLEVAPQSPTSTRAQNESRKVKVYGKRAEMQFQFGEGKAAADDVKAATGLLRVELRLEATHAIENASGGHPVLSLAAARHALGSILAEIHLDEPRPSVSDRDQLIREKFPQKAVEIAGVLNWRDKYGEDDLRAVWGKQKLGRVRRQLEKAGLWNWSPERDLPALRLAA